MADNPAWYQIEAFYFVRGLCLVGLAILALYFLGQRHAFPCVLVVVVCALFGLVQTFLDLFKNTALLPSDVLAWKTAAAVSGGYTYVLPTLAITSIMCAMVALAALAFIVPTRMHRGASAGDALSAGDEPSAGNTPNTCDTPNTGNAPSIGRRVACVVASLACCALCAGGIWFDIMTVDYQEDLGVKLGYWDLRNSYHKYGFLVSFIAAFQDLAIDIPEGYTDEDAAKLQESLADLYDAQRSADGGGASASFDRQTPSVVAIMNESYSDLSIYEELHDGYTGTFVTQSLDDTLVSGWLDTSVHGGGTCNTEYEFLTFSSMGFLSSGMYPYQQFSFADVTTLPAVFRNLGYTTWGMHPSYPGNWSREFVYATMGIDTSLFIYDFEGAEEIRGLVSDRATYDRILDILGDSSGPQFILDITMQNHSGYDTGEIPAGQMTRFKPDFLDEDATAVLNEYLACIKISDEALEGFLDELRQLDRPVAVVFFGDHQPAMSRDFN
ncbi:MAG: LTA synthase family protein, partial [Eggerthellaceae bacterium]|nr:LTA synthase family protein [Eggerthellaceae bacterium]